MDIKPQTAKPISDDQELAKVLAGITNQPNNIGFEETPAPNPTPFSAPPVPTAPAAQPEPSPISEPDPTPMPAPTAPILDTPAPNAPEPNNELESIKKDALVELRPLVDKLDLAADEKFNIYLLLLRSTDDKTLIQPAHKAATEIADETKRAQALLDIIKEIDYFSNNQQ